MEITGWFYDNFGDECVFALYDKNRHKLWEKRIIFHADIAISNIGDVAIPQAAYEIQFYDKYGQPIGKIPPNMYDNDFDYGVGPVVIHHYSYAGREYYLYTKTSNNDSYILRSFTRAGQEHWNLPLNCYPAGYDLQVAPHRILFAGRRWESDEAMDEMVYLVNSTSGSIITTLPESWTFQYDPLFLNDGKEFTFRNRSGKFLRYHSHRGKPIQELYPEAICSFLTTHDPRKILLALYYLEVQPENFYIQLPHNVIEALKELKRREIFSSVENELISIHRGRILQKLQIEDLYYENSLPYTGKVMDHYLNGNLQSERVYQDGRLIKVTTYWNDRSGVKKYESK